jgi:hypothetical protein
VRATSHSAQALRLFAGSFALISLTTALVNVLRYGIRIPEAHGMLFRPAARFGDLADPLQSVANGLPYAQFTNREGAVYPVGLNYPPGFIPPLRALSSFSLDHAEILVAGLLGLALIILLHEVAYTSLPLVRLMASSIAFVAFATATALLDLYPLVLIASASGIGILVVLSRGRPSTPLPVAVALPFAVGFPTIIAIDRMNIDIVVFFVAVVAILSLRRSHESLAMTLIGVAVAMKIYPACLLVAAPDATRWRWVLRIATVGVAFAIWSLAGILLTRHGITGGVNGFRDSLAWYEKTYVVGNAGMEYGASLLSGIKFAVDQQGGDGRLIASEVFPTWRLLWIPVCLVAALVTIALRYPIWARMTIVTTVMLLASPSTGSYRCVFLLIPIALWISVCSDGGTPPTRRLGNYAVAIAFGAALAPKSLWSLDLPFIMSLTSETLLMPIVLLLLVAATVWAGLPQRSRLSGNES